MAESMISGIVAPGRTVTVGKGVQWVGSKERGRNIPAEVKILGPGERVTLPEREFGELMAHGFIKSPSDLLAPVQAVGPKVVQEDVNAPQVAVDA